MGMKHVQFLGPCPNRTVVQNFEAASYLGRWFELEKYYHIFEAGGRCTTADYGLNPNGTVSVLNRQIQISDGQERTIEGWARITSDDGSAKLGVNFPSLPDNGEAPYWVLESDYTSFSIVWSCVEYGAFNYQFLWVLARERLPELGLIDTIRDKLDELELRKDLLIHTNQTSCE